MPSNFGALLKNRKQNMNKLADEASKLNKGGNKPKDDRFWTLTTDKNGNGFAIIRFLPAPPGEGEDVPFIKYWSYGFKGPGGWYIENSRKTLGREEADPVFEYKGELWDTGVEANREMAKKMKTNLNFISNILVIKDPANPENEGKVFLYRYGKKIFDMWNNKLEVEYEGEEPIDVFDPIEGCNFRLKAYNNEGGMRQYDKSYFDAPSPMADDEEEMERIWKSEYGLQEFIAPDNFKSYDELKKKLHRVWKIGGTAPQRSAPTRDAGYGDDDDMGGDYIPESFGAKQAPQKEEREEAPSKSPEREYVAPSAPSGGDDDDDDMSFFASLADDD